MNIRQIDFPKSQYFQEEHPKTMIFLHHTAGNPSGDGVYEWWQSNPDRVATCVAISGKGPGCVDGEIVQGYTSKHWAYHLGLKTRTFDLHQVPYKALDKISIGVEICNWGQLNRVGDKYYNYVNREVDPSEVIELPVPFKGYKYYHNYTDAQIQSVKELLLLWKQRYGIPLTFNPDIFDITTRALKGEPGVYTHNSVRTDKNDIYPHPKMIAMLKSLS